MNCVIRVRQSNDIAALAGVLVRVHGRDGYPVEGVASPIAWLDHPRAIQSWVAVANSTPVGQVTLISAAPGDDAARAWVERTGKDLSNLTIIVRLFVDPERRGIGAGRNLLSAALDHARASGHSVALDVMEKDRAAIRLYRSLGGKQISRVVHRHGEGWEEPALVFAFE